ncbi:BglG family transcription antiterminator [Enterococcus faecalis]|uniref:BglG family transcription antiterminator n=1 Tax=Enterococcus TaxID=1350 RepID=UPI0001E96816|nr:BglG family transcription antiterminator [Enterococcus faecalis]EFQ69514.1 PRD domain protein [Enterococcus faecalis TX0470]
MGRLESKQREIILFLESQQHHWVTAKELAEFCGCTTRTIRNRVAKINEAYPEAILSSQRGYRRNDQISILQETPSKERKARIFLELLKHSSEGVNLYDLADCLYISESTAKNDLQQLKEELANQQTTICFKGANIWLTGTERAKRQYMVSLLYAESDFQEKLTRSVREMIGYISLEELEEMIQQTFFNYERRLNQYVLNNIVLHYAISIERIRQGHTLLTKPKLAENHSEEYQMAKEIALRLEETYDILFSKEELAQLSLLFVGIQKEHTVNSEKTQLQQIVNPKIIEVLEEVLQKVEQIYFIQLKNKEFFNKLAIHLQGLYDRSNVEAFTRNSRLWDLKTGYPLIYDISVYISSFIQERLNIWFTEDEISFIALHLGSFLESQRTEQQPFLLLLVVEDYHNMREVLQKKLQEHFGNQINIQVVRQTNIDQKKFDLLVTTNRRLATKYEGAIFIHSFITTKELRKIENRMYLLKGQKRKRQMEIRTDQFIAKELYFSQIDPADLTPEMLLDQMIQRMSIQKYCSSDFKKSVKKREQLSPTSFPSGIAVPHAIDRTAEKSGISIMTLQEPIRWANYEVKLVALVAIRQEDAPIFDDFFEKFIEIMSEPIHIKQLSQTVDYAAFVLKFKQFVTAET